MKTTITITRQMGSAGSYLGILIAERLGIRYIDREVLHLAAEELGVEPTELHDRAERLSSFWQKALRGFTFGSPYSVYTPPPLPVITDQTIFDQQTEAMKSLAEDNDCVIVGWGGTYVLPPHPKMMTVFCHAPLDFRIKRVMDIYHAEDAEAAETMIAESDEMRQRYINQMTGKDWNCAVNYDLSFNTSLLPLEKIADIIIEVIRQRGILDS